MLISGGILGGNFHCYLDISAFETAQDFQVRQAIVKKFWEYMIVFLFILILLVVNLWCIFIIIVSTENLVKSPEDC